MRTVLFLAVVLGACSSTPADHGTGTDGGGNGGDGGGHGTVDASTTPAGAIQIIVEPNGNKGAELVTAIKGAQHSVYMTMYELDNSDVISALTGRATAGLDVQVVLDSSTTNKTFNTPAYNSLMTAGAKPVWSNPTFTYTHEKTVIIDGTVAWIMTMNANTSSPVDNREYIAIDTDAADITEATAIFHADHALQSITPTGALVVANTNARSQLAALIASATSTLDVEVEELSDTDSNGIVDAIVAAAQRHVTVRVTVANAGPDATSDNDIKTAGGKVVMTGPTSDAGTPTNPYIHAKAILVDCSGTTCARGFVGSENFSAGSLGYNRELGVITDAATELAKVKAAIDTDFAAGVAQ